MSVFNPIDWKKSEVQSLSTDTLEQLDARYVNTGENILDANINNLNLVNLNIASSGTIYFIGDNTTQTTAYDPNYVSNRINNFLTTDNTFTGENKFTKLSIIDVNDNSRKTKVSQNDTNLIIENTVNNSSIVFNTYLSSIKRTMTFDMFGNLSGLNDITCSKIKPLNIQLGAIQITNDANSNCFINNLQEGGGILFQTVETSIPNKTWSMKYDRYGDIIGVNNYNGKKVIVDEINLNPVSSRIYQSGRDIIIDNKNVPSTLKIKHLDSSNVQRTLQINEYMNMTGINDITMTGVLDLLNRKHLYLGTNYTIQSKLNGSGFAIQNYTDTGIMNELVIDKNMNMTGVNDLNCKRLLVNNSLINFGNYDNTVNRTTQISYETGSNLRTSISTAIAGFSFVPSISGDYAYNPITKAGESVFFFNNNTQKVLNICPWSGVQSGLKISETKTEIYNTKVVDGITFSDNTKQTTAMTETYLTNLIQSVVNQMGLIATMPVGVILPYAGYQYDSANGLNIINPPTGYLWCFGDAVSTTTYSTLFNVIFHNFAGTKTVPKGTFYLPDLRGAYLKGIGAGTMFNVEDVIAIGGVQQCNVGYHAHVYTDRGVDSKTIASGAGAQAIRGSNGQYWTDGYSYDMNSHELLSGENRPNSIGINYIIKY